MAKHPATPEAIGYHVGAVAMALTEGTTDELQSVVATQGQMHSLLRGWSAAALGYVTVALTSDGKVQTSSTSGGSGSGSTAVSVVGTVPVSGPLTDAELRASPVPISGGSTVVDANLSSVGSTRVIGKVDVNNPTTSVTVTNPATAVTVVPGTPGSSNDYVWVRDVSTGGGSGSGSTTVDANLTSAGSTRLVGRVEVSNPTTAVNVANPTTAVSVSSGVVLGPSTAVIGLVAQGSAGSSADPWPTRLTSGTSAVTIGAVALVAGSSANLLGAVAQGPGSTANLWYTQSVLFSSAAAARTTVNTSVDVQVIAANANRKALIIASLSTAQTVAVGLTTAVMTTALANASMYLTPSNQLSFGLSGGMPLYLGPIRAINITSTAVAGGVAVTEFT